MTIVGPYSIFGETKISDVRFSSPLASLFVRMTSVQLLFVSLTWTEWGEQELVFRKTVAEITKSCGWRGGLNYLQAKVLKYKYLVLNVQAPTERFLLR